jgi:hypothetical protein
MMIVSFNWIMKASWDFHAQKKKESYDSKKFWNKKKWLVHERLNVNDSSMITIKRKTMNSSDNRWCSEEFDRFSVDVITCWRKSQESFVLSCNMMNSCCSLSKDEDYLTIYAITRRNKKKHFFIHLEFFCSEYFLKYSFNTKTSIITLTHSYSLDLMILFYLFFRVIVSSSSTKKNTIKSRKK